MILDDAGIITLPDGVTFEASVDDIEENPKNLEFTHVDLLNLSASYEDGIPLVFNYPTYIEPLGLTPEDAVLLEDEDNTFALRVVAREGNADSDKIQALNEAFTSQEVYDFLNELADKSHLEPAFEPRENNEKQFLFPLFHFDTDSCCMWQRYKRSIIRNRRRHTHYNRFSVRAFDDNG